MDMCKNAPLGKLALNDWTKGLIMSVIGAALGTAYDLMQTGIPADLMAWKKLGVTAGSAALLAGMAYLVKNFGTGAGGQILTNNQPKEGVKSEKKA